MKIDKNKLKTIREKRGMTLRELSQATGISLSTLEKWEVLDSANPFPSKLRIITETLGIQIDDILPDPAPKILEYPTYNSDFPETVKKIIEMILYDSNCEELKTITQIINNWKFKKGE